MIHHALGQTAAKPWGIRGNVGNCRRNPALKPRLIWKNKITFMEVRYIYIYTYTLYISNQSINQFICLKWYGYSGWHFCCHPPPKNVIICAHVKLRIMFAKFWDEHFPRNLGNIYRFFGGLNLNPKSWAEMDGILSRSKCLQYKTPSSNQPLFD